MNIEELEMVESGLRLTNLFKITRRDTSRKYRDQLYLVHLVNGSISKKDLQKIKAIDSIIVVM